MAEEAADQADKTEEPTQRRLEEAYRRGDVAKSQEVPSLLVLLAATLALLAVAPWSLNELGRALATLLSGAHDIPADPNHLRRVVLSLGLTVATTVGAPLAAIAIGGLVGHLVQHGALWSLEPITPKWSKIDPIAGFKRLLSAESIAALIKGIVKLALVSAAIFFVLWPRRDRLDLMVAADPAALLPLTRDLVLQLLGAVLAVMTVVAILDFAWRRMRWMQRQRMSRQELKEEFKQQEGNPEIKAKLKQIRRARSRRRMMAEVPKATVIIANPTHFAVALRYETGMVAPRCVAKGLDALALRIRAIAESSGVPVVEDPPLARVLHAVVDLDAEIPPEYYKAVARIVGYVMSLNRKRALDPRPPEKRAAGAPLR